MRTGRFLALTLGFAAALASPAQAQKAKDTLRMAATEPSSTVGYYLDPKPDTVFSSEAVYDALISYDLKAAKVEPLLAKSWRRVDDKTLEFTLRDDVTWHDGAKLGATDVLATLRWLIDPATTVRFKQNWAWIDKVEPAGANAVRIVAKEPTPYDLIRFAYVTAIQPAHLMDKLGGKATPEMAPIGTGPYRVVSRDAALTTLEKNPSWHGNSAKPGSNIGRITIATIPEHGTRLAQLLSGNLDLIQQVPIAQAKDLARDPRFAYSVVQGRSFMYVAYDAKGRSGAKPVQDERVRRALAMAVDRKALIEIQAGDAPLVAPEAMCWKDQLGCDYSLPLPPYDPEGAKKLLAEAGYPNGFDIEITTFVGAVGDVAEAVAGQWYKIGVRAKIDRRTVAAYRGKQRDGKIEIMVAAWPAGNVPDVSGTVEAFFGEGPADYSGDDALHKLAAQSGAEMDPEKRKAIGRKLFDRATEKVFFYPVAPYPSVLVHTRDVAVGPAERFTPIGYEVSDIRWK